MSSSDDITTYDVAKVACGKTSNLPNISVVYVESRVALKFALVSGLNDLAQVRTTAPALLADPTIEAVQADSTLTPDRLRALEDVCIALGRACKTKFSYDPDVGLIAGRLAVLQLQPILAKAAFLTEADFQDPVAVVELRSKDTDLDGSIRSPLTRLLADNPNLLVIQVPIDVAHGDGDPRPPTPALSVRIKFSPIETLVYRLVGWLSGVTGLRGPRGTILMLRENELSKETAFWLLLRGYLTQSLDLVKSVRPPSLSIDEEQKISTCAVELVQQHLAQSVTKSVAYALGKIFGEDISHHVARYRASLPMWRRKLDGLARLKPKAVLTNHLNDPELISLHKVLRENKIPLVSFQHGVTIEINDRVRQYDAHLESAASDLEVTFNARAVELSEAGVFCRGRAIDVGLPKDYYRKGQLKDADAVPEVWYISTALYVANHGQIEGANDFDKYCRETAIVEKVLARLGRRVLYKPYPGRRYEDIDPIEVAVASAPNMIIYRDRNDLRYIVGSARLLITSRGYSTPSWCLMTGKPMVHIDIPEATPLPSDAREAFAAGVFLFDAGAPDFYYSLRQFLDQPIEQIEALWEKKSMARETLIQQYVSSHKKNAGRRAAREILLEISANS